MTLHKLQIPDAAEPSAGPANAVSGNTEGKRLPTRRRRVLVVWFSHAGHTAQAGERLAAVLEADRECIRTCDSYERPGSQWRDRWERLRKRSPPIRAMRYRPSDYELVVVGTPVWHGWPSAPVRRYLADYAGDFRRLGFFGVARTPQHAASAFDAMQRLCPGVPAQRLWCRLGAYGGGDPIEGLQTFVETLFPACEDRMNVHKCNLT